MPTIEHKDAIELNFNFSGTVKFSTVEQVDAWIADQKALWDPIWSVSMQNTLGQWRANFEGPFRNATQATDQYKRLKSQRNASSASDMKNEWAALNVVIGQFVSREWMIRGAPEAEQLSLLANKDPVAALTRIAIEHLGERIFVNMPNAPQADITMIMRQMVEIYVDNAAVDRYVDGFGQSIQRKFDSFSSKLDEILRERDAALKSIEADISQQSQSLEEAQDELNGKIGALDARRLRLFGALAKNIQQNRNQVRALKQLYATEMAIKAPVEYWTKRASKMRIQWILALGVFVLLAGGYAYLVWVERGNILSFLKDNDGKIQFGAVVLLGAVGAIPVWLMRMVTRIFNIGVTENTDAEQRAVMTTAFLALSKEESLVLSDAERLIMLQALFRPGSSASEDEQVPSSVIEAIARIAQPSGQK